MNILIPNTVKAWITITRYYVIEVNARVRDRVNWIMSYDVIWFLLLRNLIDGCAFAFVSSSHAQAPPLKLNLISKSLSLCVIGQTCVVSLSVFYLFELCEIMLCYQMSRNYCKSNNKKLDSLLREFWLRVSYPWLCQDNFAYSTWIREKNFTNELCQAHEGEW